MMFQGVNSPEYNGPLARVGNQVLRADGSLRAGWQDGAWVCRIGARDPPLPDASRRCELLAYPGALPVGEDFWYASEQRLLGRGGDLLCISQWHQQGGPPLFALYATGDRLSCTVRSPAGVQHLWEGPLPPEWFTVRVHARIAPAGLLRLWIDGSLVVQYVGPLGFPERPPPSAKVGLYWWPSANTWDAAVPERELQIRRAAIVPAPPLLE